MPKQTFWHEESLQGWPFTQFDCVHLPLVSMLQFFPMAAPHTYWDWVVGPTPGPKPIRAATRIDRAAILRSKRSVFIFDLHMRFLFPHVYLIHNHLIPRSTSNLSPPLLIAIARVHTAPGTVTEVKAPLLNRKPWTMPVPSV